MIEIKVGHALGVEAASARLAAAWKKHGVQVESADGGRSGKLTKPLPFVGAARADFAVRADAVEVRVTQAPAFPGADTIRRMIEDELRTILA